MEDLIDDPAKISDSESVDEEDEEDDPACPTIRVSKQDKLWIHESWRNTLILKVLGRSIGFGFLQRRLKQI